MKWPVKISVVVMMVSLSGETRSQYFSPYFPAAPVYPASTFPLHQFPYHSALRLHHPVIPHHFNVRTSTGSSNVRDSTPVPLPFSSASPPPRHPPPLQCA